MGSGLGRLPWLPGNPRIEPGGSVMRGAVVLAAVVLLLANSPARAQSWEASGLFGFTPSATIDRQATELNDVDIRGAFTWGFQGARLFTPALSAEVIWTQ